MPLVAANRYGVETSRHNPAISIRFYGSSFIADASGAVLTEAGQDAEAILYASFDLAALRQARDNWFVFRDRRPDLYGPITTHG
jgi:N-carbamoylputrescine amidase